MALKTEEPTVENLTKQLATQTKAVEKLNKELGESEKEAGELREIGMKQAARITQLEGMVTEDYTLETINANAGLKVFDGVARDPKRFIFHQALSFRNDAGWSPSAMRDRAQAAIDEAFTGIEVGDGRNRLGYVREYDPGTGKTREACTNLPAFNAALELEVIVRVLPRKP